MSARQARQQRPPKRKEEVLAAAATVMREKGVVSTRLQDVADNLGVAYTALYHYFESRDHLAAEVLCWNIENRRALLAGAEGDSAFERLMRFVRADLIEDRDVKVRLPALLPLTGTHLQQVVDSRQLLYRDVASLIELGIAEGSIRQCHAQTIANIMMTALESFVKHAGNTSPALKNTPMRIVAETIEALYSRGILKNRLQLLSASRCISRGEELLGVDPAIDSEIERLEQIYRTATRHFNLAGVQASIPKIAAELGVSKTVIYQYTADKLDLMYACYERGAAVVERSQRFARDFAKNRLDEMLIHRTNLYLFHDTEAGPFAHLNAIEHLKPQHQRLINMRNRGVRETSVGIAKAAAKDGFIRNDINPEIYQPVIGQAIYGLPNWFDERYALPIQDVAKQSLMLHYQGLSPS